MNFTQIISVRSDHPGRDRAAARRLGSEPSGNDAMAYMGTHVLADREDLGHYLIIAEFAVVDPDVSAAEEAARNNERPETQAWAKNVLHVIEGEPVYHHYDELYRTG